jgi:hypothetical protein
MSTHVPNQCGSCVFLDVYVYGQTPTCTAFPEKIPDEIWFGGDHRVPFEGDHGVTYETREGDEFLLDIWWETARSRGVA